VTESPGADAPDAIQAAGARAAKNTAVRAAGEIFGKLGSLVLFAVLARETGPVGVGVYVFALAWGEVAMAPVGLGIDRYMLRRVSADRASLDGFLWNAFYLKLARGIPIVALSAVLAILVIPLSETQKATVVIITGGMLLDTLARTLLYTFNAYERGELAAAMVTTDKVLAASLGLGALAAGYGVVAVAITFTVGTASKLALGFVLLMRKVRRPAWALPRDPRKELRRRSLPFTVEDIFGLVLSRVDVLMLSALASAAVVGLYGSAYRLIDSTSFVVVALTGAFTAMYTYLGPDTVPTLQSVYQRSIKLTVALLLPIAVAFAVLAEPLCRLFFGDALASAGDSLRLLAPVVVFFGVIVMSTNLIVSRSDPMRVVRIVAAVAVVNLGLNAVLIPMWDAQGAAAAMLVADLIYVVLALRMAVPLAGGLEWLPTLAAPVAAGAAMAMVMLPLHGLLGAALAAGAVAYFAVFAAVDSVVDPNDLRFVKSMVARRLPGRRDTPAPTGPA
jgi:O-antigen/teichoic acid export membrane protein